MEYGKIVAMQGDPPKQRRERRNWPFDALTVGTQFTVEANERNACRVALTRYNKTHSASIQSTKLDNGDLLVYIPGIAADTSPVPQSNGNDPGELEFVSYCITSIELLKSFTMPLERYGNRYDEFVGWIAKLNASQAKQFTITKDETNIVITRNADMPNFT